MHVDGFRFDLAASRTVAAREWDSVVAVGEPADVHRFVRLLIRFRMTVEPFEMTLHERHVLGFPR